MKLPAAALALAVASGLALADKAGEPPDGTPILEGVRIDAPKDCVEPDPGPAPPPGVGLPPKLCPVASPEAAETETPAKDKAKAPAKAAR